MSPKLYEKIIDECAFYDIDQIHLHGFGEPLLDKNIARKARYAKERTNAFIYIVSTMANLNQDLAFNLITSGLDCIKVSFYGATAKTYEGIHKGLQFDKTLGLIEDFISLRGKLNSRKPKLRVQFAHGIAPCDEFGDWVGLWKPRLDARCGDELSATTRHNWASGEDCSGAAEAKSERYCCWPFRDIQILWDGTVVPCCFDYDGTYVLGNVMHQSILEIWQGAPYMNFRELWRAQRSHIIPICSRCDVPDGAYVVSLLSPEFQPSL